MRNATHIRLICLVMMVFGAVIGVMGRTIDEVPNVHAKDRSRFVSDPDGYLSATALADADRTLKSIWEKTSAEPVVVIVKDMSGADAFDFAQSLFTKWGIGKEDKNNGLLVLISVDDRTTRIHTGSGVEGILPDGLLGRLQREIINPYLTEGNYDAAVTQALTALNEILTTPESVDELMSKYANDAKAGEPEEADWTNFFTYLKIGVVVGILLIAWTIYTLRRSRKKERHTRYKNLQELSLFTLVMTLAFCFMPLPAYIFIRIAMHRVRRSANLCPNCSAKMRLIDEVHDNDYLTPAQDMEEQVGSVDYDVWECPECNDVEVYPYEKRQSKYSKCPKCGAKTLMLTGNTVLRKPTTETDGVGEKTYVCKNCDNRHSKRYRIAKLEKSSGVGAAILGAAAGAALGRGGGGGGFSGGSFGGGRSGGGGTTTHW